MTTIICMIDVTPPKSLTTPMKVPQSVDTGGSIINGLVGRDETYVGFVVGVSPLGIMLATGISSSQDLQGVKVFPYSAISAADVIAISDDLIVEATFTYRGGTAQAVRFYEAVRELFVPENDYDDYDDEAGHED